MITKKAYLNLVELAKENGLYDKWSEEYCGRDLEEYLDDYCDRNIVEYFLQDLDLADQFKVEEVIDKEDLVYKWRLQTITPL